MKGFYVEPAVDLYRELSCLKEVLECDLGILHQRGKTAPKLFIEVIWIIHTSSKKDGANFK